MMRDVAVVGGGIAGIACAELLQRCEDLRVVLIEKAGRLGVGSSGDLHGWFHTGCLYSLGGVSQNVDAALANLATISRYYGHFPGSMCQGSESDWFGADPVQYVFPHDHGAEPALGSTMGRLVRQIGLADSALRQWQRHARYIGGVSVNSTDVPMRSDRIMRDLVGSFLAHGGELQLGRAATGYATTGEGASIDFADGGQIKVDHLVVATGGQGVGKIGVPAAMEVRHSPVLVTYPAWDDENFVLIEGGNLPSMSHIVHSLEGQKYSVVSGSYSAEAGDERGRQRMKRNLERALERVFGQARQRASVSYFGTKVDVRISGGRVYTPQIEQLAPRVLYVVPGKFSFAFLLAWQVFNEVTGRDHPPIGRWQVSAETTMVAPARHQTLARGLIEKVYA